MYSLFIVVNQMDKQHSGDRQKPALSPQCCFLSTVSMN
ncbi:hypothetical protein CSB69_3390 [Morganella morganii]|nr:hypothetical protein CSB69_3390 [Morganella morganii]